MTQPGTRGKAIEAFCKGCLYDPLAAGTWKEQVGSCVSANCPLHAFRPLPRQVIDQRETVAELRARLEATDRRARPD